MSQINRVSPTMDLRSIFDQMSAPRLTDDPDRDAVRRAIRMGIDILEGNPIPNRAYSGFPLLHYTGPIKVKQLKPSTDADGNVSGNVDVHQIWYDGRIESDTAMIDRAG